MRIKNKPFLPLATGLRILLLATLSYLVVACGGDDDGVTSKDLLVDETQLNIIEMAQAAGDFTILLAALDQAGLTETLADENLEFTVFAPTDDAFEDLLGPSPNLSEVENLSNILLYHVVEGEISNKGLIDLRGSGVTSLAAEKDISINVFLNDFPVLLNGEDRLIEGAVDIEASNGIIHAIDSVLIPLNNIVEVAQADPDNFSTLVEAVTKAGLANLLADEATRLTVFAPTNMAFVEAGVVVDDLSAEQLTDVLLRHVIDTRSLAASDFLDEDGSADPDNEAQTKRDLRMADDSTVEIEGADLVYTLEQTVNITALDVLASNGIIHVIDAVIPAEAEEAAAEQ